MTLHPTSQRPAVFNAGWEDVFWCKPITSRDDHDASIHGNAARRPLGLVDVALNPTAAMEVDHDWQRTGCPPWPINPDWNIGPFGRNHAVVNQRVRVGGAEYETADSSLLKGQAFGPLGREIGVLTDRTRRSSHHCAENLSTQCHRCLHTT